MLAQLVEHWIPIQNHPKENERMMKLNVKPSNGREFDPLTVNALKTEIKRILKYITTIQGHHHYSNVFFLLFAAPGASRVVHFLCSRVCF